MLDGADHEGDALVESRHPIVEPRESFRRVFLSGFRLWCFRRQLLFVHVIFSWLMTDTHVAAEVADLIGGDGGGEVAPQATRPVAADLEAALAAASVEHRFTLGVGPDRNRTL